MGSDFAVTTGTIGELFWNVADAVLVCRQGRVLGWNPGAEVLFGRSADEVTGGADLGPVFGDALATLWELVDAAPGRSTLDCSDGSGRVLDANAWFIGGQPGAPVVVVLRDVTDEHRRRAGLRRLNALARELVAQPSLDVLLVRIADAAKDLVRADFSALLLLRDGTADEIAHFVYNAPRELFPARLPRVVGLLSVPIRTGAVARIDDIRGHAAGVGIPVEHPPIAALLAAPVYLQGRVVGELVVANGPELPPFDEVDEGIITELAAHAAMAVSLAMTRQAREELDATRRAVMDVALHNLRTPLTVAKGFASTLRNHGDRLSAADRDRAFEAIDKAHRRILELAEGALLAEPEATSVGSRHLDAVVVADLLAEFAKDADDDDGIAVLVQLEPGMPAVFRGELQLVRDVLEHLVSNAVKHSEAGQVVTVTAREEGGSLRFDVSDQGPGIPPEEQAQVFEQFYRTRHSVQQEVQGSGLGLWIARRLARLQGGTVGVSSRSGQGTTFWATFPLDPARAESPTPLSGPPSTPPLS